MSVFLCRDASGLPSATQTYLGTVAPTESLGTTNNSVVSLVVAGKVPVVQGLDYWLVLKPAVLETPPGFGVYMADIWHDSFPRTGGSLAYSHNGGVNWTLFTQSNEWGSGVKVVLPAFGITGWPPPLANFFRKPPGAYGER